MKTKSEVNLKSTSKPAESTRGSASAFPLLGGLILVGIDYSDYSKAALEYAMNLAELTHSRVHLLSIIENKTTPDFENFPIALTEQEQAAAAREKLVQFAKSAGHPDVLVSPEIEVGRAWEKLVERAQTENASLIVVGTHGYSRVEHVLMGSTAEKVVRHAHCPVLVIR